jgi:KDO2-lipid IV(A) lauroyltransferase
MRRGPKLPPWVKRLRQRGEYAAFRIVAFIFTALTLETASTFSAWGWRTIAPLLPRHKRALANLQLAFPEKTADERERIARAMWSSLGSTFGEFFHMDQILAEKRIAMEPAAFFDDLAKGPSFVVCGLHFGNWEITSQVGLRIGLPISGTYKAAENPLVDAWVTARRAKMYPGGLFDKSPATARKMLRIAREGGYPAFLGDLRERAGVPTIFFGSKAMSNPFPALVARSLDRPIYAACIRRLPGTLFEARLERIDPPRTSDRAADVQAMTQALQSVFEAFIRETPEQWMWAHRRWE